MSVAAPEGRSSASMPQMSPSSRTSQSDSGATPVPLASMPAARARSASADGERSASGS